MRRNYNEGIAFLESIKRDLGFEFEFKRISSEPLDKGKSVEDEFHDRLRAIYPMFLSYGYFCTS